ncbi:hypothetical protein HQ545_03140 [Candidatus Woesearchaeota archaeon]|nr:hypothetical protein [Candidatus Woesearchaeota archaeon]
MDRIKGLRKRESYARSFAALRMTNNKALRMTNSKALRMTVENCILVVYLLAFGDATCYNANSSNLQTSSPSGAAIVF